MALDLFALQETIKAHIEAEFPEFDVEEDGIPDDQTLLRVNGKVKPYIVLTWGSLSLKPGGRSLAGVRYDDYYSTVDMAFISAVGKDARASLSVIVDRLIGWKPTGGDQMAPSGASATLVVRNVDNQVTAYVASQRMRFGVNGENVGARIVVP